MQSHSSSCLTGPAYSPQAANSAANDASHGSGNGYSGQPAMDWTGMLLAERKCLETSRLRLRSRMHALP